MLRHNLLLIYRNFRKFKSTFFINLIGLSTGLACTLLIYLWVKDELSVDKFFANDDRLYQVMEHRVKANGIWTAYSTPGIMAETIAEEMSAIEYASACAYSRSTLSVGDENLKAQGRSVGKDYFKIFSFEFIEGKPDAVLKDKQSIVISEDLAMKLFKTTQNLTGKAISIDHEQDYFVSGIFKNVPLNASDRFDFVLSFEKYRETRDYLNYWGNTNVSTFVLLKPGASVEELNKQFANLVKVKTNNEVTHRTPFLKHYSDIYLHGKYENGVEAGGRITYVTLFSTVAIFILIIACINFMNLSTAKASRRIKEVGVKKAVGAARRTLITQYLSESILLSFLSLLVAVLLVDILLSHFNDITGKQLSLSFDLNILLSLAGITLFTGIVAGSYPALYLSGFNPAAVLKGKLNTATGELWARKGLVVLQFTLSIIFIISVVVVYKQIEYIQSQNLGYEKDNLVFFAREGAFSNDERLESTLNEIKKIDGVAQVSSISHDMTGHNWGTSGVKWEGKDPEDHTEFEVMMVNYDMLETLGIKLAEGRTFAKEFGTDSAAIIFSQKAIDFMAMKNPVGKTVTLWGDNRHIIGVAKDLYYESLHEPVKPILFVLNPGNTYYIMARLEATHQRQALQGLQQYYLQANPGFTFDAKFLDDDYQAQYVSEQRVATLSRYFAGLAILISCLGLFGLAAFTAERRLKEIGIRKVLGASETGILFLLSGGFTKMVVLSIAIAIPVSYFLISRWLDTFAFKTELHWYYFAGAGLVALITAWTTVSIQSIKSARVNPTKCLQSE
jgi:predicted permease